MTNVDNSFSSLQWKIALMKIIDNHQERLDPLLIFRESDPISDQEISNHFRSKERCYYIRLGKSCPSGRIEHEIAIQLNLSFYRRPDGIPNVFLKISKTLEKLGPVIIAIDYSHPIVTRNIFRIVRLMRKLHGVAFFIFLFPTQYQLIWINKLKSGDQFLKYFLDAIIIKTYSIGQSEA